jgi:hypothetical protein
MTARGGLSSVAPTAFPNVNVGTIGGLDYTTNLALALLAGANGTDANTGDIVAELGNASFVS